MNRREFLSNAGALLAAPSLARAGVLPSFAPRLTPPEVVLERLKRARPMLGGTIPADISRRLGATHYAGKYYRTKEPFLIEGCNALRELGLGVAKLWFDKKLPGYGYNSEWNLPPAARLADVARHPYFVQAFDMPFNCFALEIQHVGNYGGTWRRAAAKFDEDEQQFYELAAYLLKTYRDRHVRFILQHWEGDWMIRDFAGQTWDAEVPENVAERCDAMLRWLTARQNGVLRARKEAGETKCKVEHAAEVNRVLDALKGIPTLTTHVLPRVALDWVSWSSYDAMNSPVDTWHGLEIIRHYARPSPGFDRPRVYVGEVGLPERERPEESIAQWWDQTIGVFIAQEVPYVIHWQLYCNEPVKGAKRKGDVFETDQLRGFWLVRPDGSPGRAAEYFKLLLQHGGRRLSEHMLKKE